MVGKYYVVVWTKRSQQHMRQIFDYICKDSYLEAGKVLEEIIIAANKAISNPEFYPRYKYKIDNDGSYRAFEKFSYRISYRFTEKTIRILRVRHTGREPKDY